MVYRTSQVRDNRPRWNGGLASTGPAESSQEPAAFALRHPDEATELRAAGPAKKVADPAAGEETSDAGGELDAGCVLRTDRGLTDLASPAPSVRA
jgi:hypothetical protein